jgi:hypothetical protein
MPFQIRPEKKETNVEKIIYEKKNFTIYRSCTIPNSRLAIIRCAVPIAIVAPLKLQPEKKRYSRLSVVMPFQINPEKKRKKRGKNYL